MLINHLFCSSRSKFGHRLDNHALRASPAVVSRIRHSRAQTRMLYLVFCIVRFWADPPLLTFALEAGLFAFIERGAQFELFALYRQRRAASPSLCFNHAHGRFRGHSPNGGLVCCTWIFISNYLQGRGRSAKRPTIIPYR